MLFLRLISRLPMWVLHMGSSMIAFLMYQLFGYRKKIVMDNLRRSFPDKAEKELRAIAKAFYLNFTDIFVETLKGLSISREEMKQRVEIEGLELLEEAYAAGHHVVALTSHSCNWEWVLLGVSAQVSMPTVGVYKPLASSFSDQMMLAIRGRFGAIPVRMHQLAKRMVKMRQTPEIYGMVADQSPGGNSETYFWRTFLHQETMFYKGVSVLAPKLQATVVYVSIKRLKRGHYKLIIEPMRKPPYNKSEDLSILYEYTTRLEKEIRQHPSDWLWSHKRWKRQRPEEAILHD